MSASSSASTAQTQSLHDALQAFVQAIAAGDEQAARAACTDDGWSGEGDPARRLFDQAVRKGLRPEVLTAPEPREGRAAPQLALYAEGREAPVGTLWLLMRATEAGWRVETTTRSGAHAARFLEGALPAVVRPEALPDSPEARTFGERVVAALGAGDAQALGALAADAPEAQYALESLQAAAGEPEVAIDLIGAFSLAPVGRAAVGLAFNRPGEDFGQRLWLILEQGAGGALALRGAARSPSVAALLEGLG